MKTVTIAINEDKAKTIKNFVDTCCLANSGKFDVTKAVQSGLPSSGVAEEDVTAAKCIGCAACGTAPRGLM